MRSIPRLLRTLPLAIGVCALAACARHLHIYDASVRGEQDFVVIQFKTDQDIFTLGVIPHGDLYVDREIAEVGSVAVATVWLAKLKDEPVRVEETPEGKVYTYRWEYPARAEAPYHGPIPGGDERSGPIIEVRVPYDLTRPGVYALGFKIIGPVCGCRPVVSDRLTLRYAVPPK